MADAKPNLHYKTEVQKSVTTVTTVTNGLDFQNKKNSRRFKNANCHKSVTKLSPNSDSPYQRENSIYENTAAPPREKICA